MLSQLMTLFGFFALILVAVYWVNQAVRLFDQLISDGQSAWVFLEFTALSLPFIIRVTLAVAAFITTIYVTNRLSQESELVVMRATGFSPWRLARPVAVFGLILGLGMALLAHALEPAAKIRLADRRGEIAANVTSRILVEGRFVHPAQGVTLFIGQITQQGELKDLFLSDNRRADRQTIYNADRAALVRSDTGPKLVMFDGMAQTLRDDSGQLTLTRFADFSYDIGALIAGPAIRAPKADEIATAALFRADAGLAMRTGLSPEALRLEAHFRVAMAFQPLAAALIGFAALMVGGFTRFGLVRQIALAVVALIAVQFLTNFVASVTQKDPGLWPLAYLPNSLGIAFAAALLWHSGRARRVAPAGPSAAEAAA